MRPKNAVRWKLTQNCRGFEQLLTQCDSWLFSQSLDVDRSLHYVLTYNNRSSLATRERVVWSQDLTSDELWLRELWLGGSVAYCDSRQIKVQKIADIDCIHVVSDVLVLNNFINRRSMTPDFSDS